MIEAAHWRELTATAWPRRNLSPADMAGKGDGSLRLSCGDSMDRLQHLRARLGVPMRILSAYRDPPHNKRVGGAGRSAAWLSTSASTTSTRTALIKAVRAEGFKRFGA